jgi:hypothetical protein
MPPLGQQLQHLAAGQRVGQVPPHRHHDHIPGPAIAAEGGHRVLGEGASARAAGVFLAAPPIAAVAFGGGVLAGGTEWHKPTTLSALSEFPNSAREGLAGAVSQSEPPRRENTTDGVDERHSRRTPVPRVADDRHAIRRKRWPPTWCGAILNLLRLISVGGGALPVRGPTWNRIRSTTTASAMLSGAAPITPACSWRCCPPSSASKSTTLATAPR